MSKPPDLEALARRYVELWQDQLVASAADPEVTDGLARLLQIASGGLAAQAGLWQALWPDLTKHWVEPGRRAPDADEPARDKGAPTAPGSAPLAGASHDGGHDVAQLQARLALLEERLASLEGGPGIPRRSPRPRSPRRRTS